MFINRLFTGRPPARPQPQTGLDTPITAARVLRDAVERIETLESALSKLQKAHRDLDEQHSTTVSHLHKLRGQVHGGRHGHVARGGPGEVPFGDKDALRAAVGLRAGQRFIHNNDEE